MTNLLFTLVPIALFFGLLGMTHLGRKYRSIAADPAANAAVAPIVSILLALIGLVLAFSFSNAAGRLDASRKTILDEVNAIETAWMRVDLAVPEAQPRLRALLRSYLDARIRAYEAYDAQAGGEEYQRELRVASDLLGQLWHVAVEGTEPTPNRTLLLAAVGAVSDAAMARRLSLGTHIPPAIFAFLFGIVLVGAVLVGTVLSVTSARVLLYRIIFAGVLSTTIYAIMDMEYPRLGPFRLLRHADVLLVELRQSMD